MNRYLFYIFLLAGCGFRVLMLIRPELVNGGDVDVYLADEGVVGLMGKHILEGRELPVFFYGQHYLGALEAYCAALSFAVFGTGLASLRLVPFVFSIALAVVVYRYSYRVYSVAVARWATALVAVSPYYFLQWNLKARGGFIEHVVLVFVVLLLFWRFYLRHERAPSVAFGLGLASGIALWVNQLMAAYLMAMGMLLALERSDRRGWVVMLAGGLLGASLLIGYNVVHPMVTLRSLARKSVVLNRVPVEQRDEDWLARGVGKRVEALSQGSDKLAMVFGVPPGEDVEQVGVAPVVRRGGALTTLRRGLWPLPLAVFGLALVACRPRKGKGGWEKPGSDQILALFSLMTFLVGYVSPRYMLPAYPLASVMAGVLVSRMVGARRRLMIAGVMLVVAFNIVSWADAMQVQSGSAERRSSQLLDFLESEDLRHCYSAGPLYHVVFRATERVVVAPLQKDRYSPYNSAIEKADSVCYIFRDDQRSKRQHLALMRLLSQERVSFSRGRAGPYNVLFGFSPRGVLSSRALSAIRRSRSTQAPRVGGNRSASGE